MNANQANTAPQESACAASNAPQPIATVRSYDDLRRAVADWCDHIGMSRAELEAEAGLADGHASKLLSAKARKRLGIVSLGRVMAAAGLVLIVAIDPESEIGADHACEAACEKKPNGTKHWRTHKGSAWGRRMAALRALKLSAPRRSEIGRIAAQARLQHRQAASAPATAAPNVSAKLAAIRPNSPSLKTHDF
jgi:hypothetical protein